MTAVLELDRLVKHFRGPRRGSRVHAVNGVTLSVEAGEAVALVGESGSGKSTLGRLALRLEQPTAGTIRFNGQDITGLSMAQLRPLRRQMQMVFQDPWGTLNPRMTVGSILDEPLRLHSTADERERRRRVVEMAARVRLDEAFLGRYPAQLSGGQLQRVAIARALMNAPQLVILDEPTSSLDLSVRAEILKLLTELRAETGAAFVFITHDLATVRLIASRVAVLYLGSLMEVGPTAEVFERPVHPYTQALFSAQLSTDPAEPRRRHVLSGEVPSPLDLPPGCPFAARCPVAIADCTAGRPPLERVAAREVACLRVAGGGNILDTRA